MSLTRAGSLVAYPLFPINVHGSVF